MECSCLPFIRSALRKHDIVTKVASLFATESTTLSIHSRHLQSIFRIPSAKYNALTHIGYFNGTVFHKLATHLFKDKRSMCMGAYHLKITFQVTNYSNEENYCHFFVLIGSVFWSCFPKKHRVLSTEAQRHFKVPNPTFSGAVCNVQ